MRKNFNWLKEAAFAAKRRITVPLVREVLAAEQETRQEDNKA